MSACATRALRLLGRWGALSRAHVSFALGCSCGLGAPATRITDFEQDLLDYLRSKHPFEYRSLDALLRGIAGSGAARGAGVQSLLSDLERALESFEELHRAAR